MQEYGYPLSSSSPVISSVTETFRSALLLETLLSLNSLCLLLDVFSFPFMLHEALILQC